MQPEAFDAYAKSYDGHFTNSIIGKAQRLQVYTKIIKYSKLNIVSVLEINCGTGEDALWLAIQGSCVLATDISQGMIDVAEKKTKNKNIVFKQLDCKHIGSLKPSTYNLIFSNFGGLNCLKPIELNEFKTGCLVLQNKNDQLAFVIMGTKCWWERFYFKWKKEKAKASRRLDLSGTNTCIENQHFKTYYHSPEVLKQIFDVEYDHVTTKPIGLFVPPSYLEEYIKNKNVFFGFLKLMDSVFGNMSFLSNYADHYLIVFKKK